MDGRTHQLLRALGNETRLVVLVEITVLGRATHHELLNRTGIGKVPLSKALGELADLGLVVRPPTNRGAWTLRLDDATRVFLAAAADLAAGIAEAQATADRDLAARLRAFPEEG